MEGQTELEGVAAEELVDGAGGDGGHARGGGLVPREVAVGVDAVLLAHVGVVAQRVGRRDDDDGPRVDEPPGPGAGGVHLEERRGELDNSGRANALVAVHRAAEEYLGRGGGAKQLVAEDEDIHLRLLVTRERHIAH